MSRISFEGLGFRILCGDTMVPNNGESNGKEMEKKWNMKWKLGLYSGYLCSILFGDTMVSKKE